MRIILDADKNTITVPWNYADKLEAMKKLVGDAGGKTDNFTFKTYLETAWNKAMEDTDKSLVVADKPKRK